MFRNVTIILRGAVIAQLIGFVALLLLARLYDPDAFGVFQFYQSCLVILGVSINLRFEIALLRSEDGTEIGDVFYLCVLSNIALTFMIFVAMGIGAYLLPNIYDEFFRFPWWLLPIAVSFYGLTLAANNLSLRNFHYIKTSNSKVVQSLVYVSASSGLGFYGLVSVGLLIADVAARMAASFYLLKSAIADLPKFNLPRIMRAAGRYRAFAFISSPSGVINAIGGTLTPIMMYATFSPAIAGQFALVERSLTMAVALVSGSVSQVYSSQMAELIRTKGDLRKYFRNLIVWVGGIGIVPAIILALFADEIFGLLFGAEWFQAGRFAQFMAPALLFILISGCVNMTLVVIERQSLQMTWEVGRLIVMAALWYGIWIYDLGADQSVQIHAIAVVLTSLAFLGLAHHAIKLHARHDVADKLQ